MSIFRARNSYFRAIIAVNGHKSTNNGLHVIEGNGGSTNYRTMAVSGNLQLKKGQYASVFVYSSVRATYTVNSESGFSCNKLATAVGFRADKTNNHKISKKGFMPLNSGWRINGEQGLYSVGGSKLSFNTKNGQVKIGQRGIYFCSLQVRVDSEPEP